MKKRTVLVIEPDIEKAKYLVSGLNPLLEKLNKENPAAFYAEEAVALQFMGRNQAPMTIKEYTADPFAPPIWDKEFEYYDVYKNKMVRTIKAGFDELARDCYLLLQDEFHPTAGIVNLGDFQRKYLDGQLLERKVTPTNLLNAAIVLNTQFGIPVLGLVDRAKMQLDEYAGFPVWCSDYSVSVEEMNEKKYAPIPPSLDIDPRKWNAEERKRFETDNLDPTKSLEYKIRHNERIQLLFRGDTGKPHAFKEGG